MTEKEKASRGSWACVPQDGLMELLTPGICGEISQLSEVKQLASELPTEGKRAVLCNIQILDSY